MRTKRIWTCFVAIALLCIAGVVFAQSNTIVFIPKSTSATFYLFLVKGAADKAKQLGYKIQYLGPATEADVAAQVDFVRTIIKRHPAGILLAALDSKALIPPVEEAMKAGVPVAMVDSGIDSDAPVATIITDQVKGGMMAGDAMAKLLGDKGLSGRVFSFTALGDTWYRVRVGPYTSKGEASKFLAEVQKLQGLENSFVARVVPPAAPVN